MPLLVLVEGPAGSGKICQEVARMLAASEVDVQADMTQIWAATRGIEREPSGRYPIRQGLRPGHPKRTGELSESCRSPAVT